MACGFGESWDHRAMEVRPTKLERPIMELAEERAEAVRSRVVRWDARLVIDVSLFLGTAAMLGLFEAPPWAFVLAMYVATRTARIDSAADMAALQSTCRVRLEATEHSMDRLVEALEAAAHPNIRRR